jgi:cyclophilin family peptidyl-prolyl cis-trans isomerase
MRNKIPLIMSVLLAACGGEKAAEKKPPPEPAAPPPEIYRVLFVTSKGNFVIEARREWAPRGADHFFELVQAKFYDGVRFHRVIRRFICQFGINGNPKLQQLWSTAAIPDDPVQQKNRKGMVTFAKLGPNSRTTQLFINLKDNLDLDKSGFAPFASVVQGMDVVEKLYFAYGEVAPRGGGPDPTQIELQGNTYLDRTYPRLDSIRKAAVIK